MEYTKNSVSLIGFCADKPKIIQTKEGKPMAVLVIYTRDRIARDVYVSQPHRCLFFGKKADEIERIATKGSHVRIDGMLRSQRKGEGKHVHYYTSIIVKEFSLSPPRHIEALKGLVKKIIEDENITNCDQLGIFQE